jgi:hypothetical protein
MGVNTSQRFGRSALVSSDRNSVAETSLMDLLNIAFSPPMLDKVKV